MLRLLIVEDTPAIRKRVVRYFTEALSGYEVSSASSRDEALALLPEAAPDLVLLDLVLPAGPADGHLDSSHGEAVLSLAKRLRPQTKVIVFSAEGQLVRDFLREKGADDFFTKDSPEAWIEEKLPAQVESLIGHLACRSSAMRDLRTQLSAITEADRCFLITGPAGAGKRHLAGILHRCSRDADHVCGALALTTLDATALQAAAQRVGGGTLALTGLEHTELLGKPLQLVLASHLSKPHPPLRTVLTSATEWEALVEHGSLLPDLARELQRVRRLRMPGLAERQDDVPELAECFRRQAALAQGRSVRRLSEAAHMALRSALTAGALAGEAAGLAQAVADAVRRASGDAVEPQDLGLTLPAEHRVLVRRDGATATQAMSEPELRALEADRAMELTLYAEPDQGAWRVVRLRLKGEEREVTDERVGRLLFVLAAQPGETIEVRPRKHALGLLEHEQARRYVFLLRQLLDDTDFEGRDSHFVSSHYGEAYSFNPDVGYCLVRRLSSITAGE